MRIASLLAALALLALAMPVRADTLADVRTRGELRWGGDLQGGEPYVYEDPHDPRRIVGFEVDIAEALARRLGVQRASFVQVQWSNLVPSLERGDFDVALNGLEDTPERRARLRLTRPYFVYQEVLAVRRGAPYRSLDDLRGKRVATLNQTYAQELLRAHSLETVLYEGQQEPYFDLQQARVDAVLLDHIIADRYGCPLPGVDCLSTRVASGTYVAATRLADETLAQALDGAIAGMIGDGELRRILTAWKLWDDAPVLADACHAAGSRVRARDRLARWAPGRALREGGGGHGDRFARVLRDGDAVGHGPRRRAHRIRHGVARARRGVR